MSVRICDHGPVSFESYLQHLTFPPMVWGRNSGHLTERLGDPIHPVPLMGNVNPVQLYFLGICPSQSFLSWLFPDTWTRILMTEWTLICWCVRRCVETGGEGHREGGSSGNVTRLGHMYSVDLRPNTNLYLLNRGERRTLKGNSPLRVLGGGLYSTKKGRLYSTRKVVGRTLEVPFHPPETPPCLWKCNRKRPTITSPELTHPTYTLLNSPPLTFPD